MSERKTFTRDAKSVIDGTVMANGALSGVLSSTQKILPDMPAVDLDFVFKPNISREELEDGIADILQGAQLSSLVIALAAYKINSNAMWLYDTKIGVNGKIERIPTHMKASVYWEKFGKRFAMDRTTIDNYIRAGQNYTQYRQLLESIKFSERGNFTKLIKLDRVMKNVDDGLVDISEVRLKLVSGTLESFSELYLRSSKKAIEQQPQTNHQPQQPISRVEVEESTVKVNDEPLLSFSAGADQDLREKVSQEVKDSIRRKETGLAAITMEVEDSKENTYKSIIQHIQSIMQRGNFPIVIEAYDQKEAVVAQKYTEQFLADRRKNDMVTPAKYKKGQKK